MAAAPVTPSGVAAPRGERRPWTWWLRLAVAVWAVLSFLDDGRTALARADSSGRAIADIVSSGCISGAILCVLWGRRWIALAWTLAVGLLVVLSPSLWGTTARFPGAHSLSVALLGGWLAYRGDRRVVALVLAGYLLVKACILARSPEAMGATVLGEIPALAVALALAWAGGNAVRRRAAAEARVEELARQSEVARERERALLARELHDVVAHELTIIAMQAGILRVSVDEGERRQARDAIERTSRTALDELKRLLQVLRTSEELPEGVAAAHDSVAQVVQAVAEQLRAVGREVNVRCDVRELPRSVEIAADRVLREAATNVAKYSADDAHVWIQAVQEDDALRLVVANDGLDLPLDRDVSSTYLGLPGLAERVSLLGGEFAAAREEDRWVLRARIPTHATVA